MIFEWGCMLNKMIMRGLVFVLLLLTSGKSFGLSMIAFGSVDKRSFLSGDSIHFVVAWNSTSTTEYFNIGIRSVSTNQFYLLEKISYYDATVKYSGNQLKNGAYYIGYKIPITCITDSFNIQMTVLDGSSAPVPRIYVKNNDKSVTLTYYDNNSNITTGQSYNISISYTYAFQNTDTLIVKVGDSIVYKGNYNQNITFHIPNLNTGNYPMYITNNINGVILNITRLTTSIIDPVNNPTNIQIHYYNIQGLEIEKPSKGLIIWKTETGESGKLYINIY